MFNLKENEILVLRTCDENMCGHGGFRWPTGGRVEAPDWDGLPKCGGGLHGLPKGVGSAQYLDHSAINWLIVKVDTAAGYVEFDGKCKFKGGEVVFVGGQAEAVKLLQEQYPSEPVVFGTATAGNLGTATAGVRGTATAGDWGTATAGNLGTATAGDRGVLVIDYKTDVGYSRAVAAVDGESIKPNTPYRCENGVFVEANGKEER